MGAKKEFEVLGQKIVVRTQEEADLALHALEIVNKKIEALKEKTPHLAPHQLSVLALVEVAGDLVKDRKVMDDYRHELDQKCSYLLTALGNVEGHKNAKKSKAV